MAEMYNTVAWAKSAADSEFSKIEIKRNKTGDNDVTFELKYCGICHTDVHIANNEMGSTNYPCVPGHELAGIVTEVGKNVTKYKVLITVQHLRSRHSNNVQVGDRVGVGCIVDCCMQCKACKDGEEHLCDKGVCFI